MDKTGVDTALKDIRKASQEALGINNQNMHMFYFHRVKALMHLLQERRLDRGSDKDAIDRFVKQFLRELPGEDPEIIDHARYGRLKIKSEERLVTLHLIGAGHKSPHLLREALDVCTHIVRACNHELNDAMPTHLGRPRLEVIKK